ncbi:hypothetical protein AC249_AIPGENE22226 [Exaiptasia diaphana]|nr:hypothetical protein AC249_AIPGENE22226 [Exaiptasia diaphana]
MKKKKQRLYDEIVQGSSKRRRSRSVDCPRDANKNDLIKEAKELFFPNGTSRHGKDSQMTFDLMNFKGDVIDNIDFSVQKYIDEYKLTKLTLYLTSTCTAAKPIPIDVNDEYISDDSWVDNDCQTLNNIDEDKNQEINNSDDDLGLGASTGHEDDITVIVEELGTLEQAKVDTLLEKVDSNLPSSIMIDDDSSDESSDVAHLAERRFVCMKV